MKKEIEIHLDRPVPVFLKNGNVSIVNPSEKWGIFVHCQEKDATTNRELAEITINLHNGVKWQGSIQALAAIDYFAHNAQLVLSQDDADHETRFEAFKDLTSLISHFSKGEPVDPVQYIKVLHRELIGISKSIEGMCSSFTDLNVVNELQRSCDGLQDAGMNLERIETLLSGQPAII